LCWDFIYIFVNWPNIEAKRGFKHGLGKVLKQGPENSSGRRVKNTLDQYLGGQGGENLMLSSLIDSDRILWRAME
jgi:hypothetical protein